MPGDLSEQAAGWFLRLRNPACSEAERRAFDAWLATSECHRDEYRQYERLWGRLDALGTPVPRRGGTRRAATVLAILAVGLGLAAGWRSLPEEQVVATGIGERRQVALADGTRVDLNADTRLVAVLDSSGRRITLERGEALFAVAPDPARPFEVRAGNGVLRDIGTAFDVAVEADRVSVGVLEGAVAVRLAGREETAVLAGGERLAYSAAGMGKVERFDGEAATAWRGGRFVFRDTPLDDVLRQLNRHHPRPAYLADAGLARLRVSGAFNIADREGLLTALEALYPVRRQEGKGETRLAWRGR